MKIATLVVLAALVLAGCADSTPDTIVVDSSIRPVESTAPPVPQKGDDIGHIAGYVVDQSFKTLEGIVVELPGYDLRDTTDRKGEFSFVDLPAGVYVMRINDSRYQQIQTTVEVHEDEFTRLQVILHALPPAAPRHVTTESQGYSPFSNMPGAILRFGEYHPFDVEPGLHTLVIEAFWDRDVQGAGFNWELEEMQCCTELARGQGLDPLRVELQLNGTELRDQYRVYMSPYSLVPEIDVRYELFVTAFYNGPPPEGWSIQDAS